MASSIICIEEGGHGTLDGTSLGIHSNLRCFLESITPIVKAHRVPNAPYLSLSNNYCANITEGGKYYYLGDLWNRFYEWSTCGVGTSVCIAPGEKMVQYFVPYLSAIQLYTNRTMVPTSQRCNGYNHHGVINEMDTNGYQSQSHMSDELLFKYFEHGSPYERVPFVDKVYELSYDYPSLTSLRSVDISPSSWMSIFWYPTSHVPTKNKKDMDTCFLTYHILSTFEEIVALDIVHASDHVALAPFGLATYKLDSKVWASTNSSDQEHIATLFDAAHSWLRKKNIYHHDFNYFSHRCSSR
ncbi:hypothetical protein BS78_02G028400 [Paspalum vaginatum]|nr:hypothetical protein BS78_02G028400 [Paspalum vaginatum]